MKKAISCILSGLIVFFLFCSMGAPQGADGAAGAGSVITTLIPFILIIGIVVFAVWIEWKIGKAIGTRVSKNTGIIIGILGILLGFSILIGIACIIYSQKNKDDPLAVNVVTKSDNNTVVNIKNDESNLTGDTRECPHCAEIIKKKATVCRFCGKEVSPVI